MQAKRQLSLPRIANWMVIVAVTAAIVGSGCSGDDSEHGTGAADSGSAVDIQRVSNRQDAAYAKTGERPAGPVTVTLRASTFWGGSGYDEIRDILVDDKGFVYITGRTSSRNLPTTTGVYQRAYGGGPMDTYVAKLSPDLSSVIWCGYLGGSNYEVAYGIGSDNAGNVYVAGRTSSPDFPTTPNAYSRTYKGGKRQPPYFGGDIFVSKLSPDGTKLLYSTYIGGSGDEWARNMTVDPARGEVYLTGPTESKDFPVTPGAISTTYNGAPWDAHVVKVSADGSSLIYASYLGGVGEDRGQAVAVDSLGMAYVAGYTASPDFPTTSGAFQKRFAGDFDVWIAKISSDGKKLVYSTFVGGSGNDGAEQAAIVVDAEGHAYVNGYTHSKDFPTSNTAYQKVLKGSIDNFILRLSPDGSKLVFSTYFGGGGDCWETAFGAPGVDGQGNAYASGGTACTDFPVTPDAYQRTTLKGGGAFVVKFSGDGSELLYSTYIAGSKHQMASGLAVDPSGAIYVVGRTGSPDFPTTAKAAQKRFRGYGDAFITLLK